MPEFLMRWCEKRAVYYLFGLAKNSRLLARIRKLLAKSVQCYQQTGKSSRRLCSVAIARATLGRHARQVIAKAESLVKGDNPQFVR